MITKKIRIMAVCLFLSAMLLTGASIGQAQIVINEVDADQVGTDSAEFVELYDGGVGNTSLTDLSLVLYNGSDNLSYLAFDLDGQSTDGNGYFVLCGDAANVANCDLDVSPNTNLIQNGEDAVALLVGDAVNYPNDTALPADGDIVDAIVYETGSDTNSGLLVLLNAGQSVVDEGGGGNQTSHSNQRCPNGSGGPRNTDTYIQFNPTPGAENYCTVLDTPPTVASTTPADTATDVALDADITINFSENVTATDPWFSINCASSGAHTAASSSGPQNYVLYPDADFVANELCTVTVVAAQVADQDNPPDNMTGDYQFAFNVVSASTGIIINEILADPASGLAGDANGDGTRDGSQDEFVEIVNNTGSDMDISGWTLADGSSVRHTFPAGTVVVDGCGIVVFGGGTPTGTFGGVVVQTAGSGPLGLNNGGDAVTLNDGSSDQATMSYGSEGGNNQSITRDPDLTGSFVQHSTAGGAFFSPGTQVDGTTFSGCPVAPPATMKIHEIQGSGAASPEVGNTLTIEGIVVGVFQGAYELDGFFVQEEDADIDADPGTSEGIFVHSTTPVAVGDKVEVTGEVKEYFGLTEMSSSQAVNVVSSGNPLPAAATITLPFTPTDDLEWHEGMLVTFTQELTVSDTYNLIKYGEMILSNGRLFNPTNITTPGAAANTQQAANNLNQILVDDGRNGSYRTPFPYGFNASNPVRMGYTVTNLTGVMHYGYGKYRLQPTISPVFDTLANPRTATPASIGGTLKVASVNLLNYFTTIDYGFPACGLAGDQDCRGANSLSELSRQRDKTINVITTIDADIIGLMELENNATTAIQDLVDGLNAVTGAGTYGFINTGTIGDDVIRVALIYKTAAVTPLGSFAIIDSSVDPRFNDDKNRPTLAQTFQEIATGEKLTVAVNHFKSKGSPCTDLGDPDTGDGQGNCNKTRENAAFALVDWLATDPTGSGDPDFLIIGDLNSYAMEDPITAIKNAGYTNLIDVFGGSEAYSYVYFAQAGYLDHVLANNSLTLQVTGTTDWHINADEHRNIDYNEEPFSSSVLKPVDFYIADQYRASDHDPVLVGLDLRRIKDVVGTDRLPETSIFDVFAGDIFTYTIEFENPFEQAMYFMVTDTLNTALQYVNGPFSMNAGTLEYTTPGLLGSGGSILLSFDVQVKDVPVGTLIDNTAWITAWDIAGSTLAVFEAIAPQAHVIPEPATLFLLGIGLIGIFVLMRKR